jgi:glucoamylase
MIPEQIWDKDDIPEKELLFGKHTGSAMPLTWAHAEYIKLCASIKLKKIVDMPKQTQERYLDKETIGLYEVWRFTNPIREIETNKMLRIEVLANAIVTWTNDNWKTTHKTPTRDIQIGIFVVDLPLSKEETNGIEFTFYWPDENRWEEKNFLVARKGE